MPQALDDRVAEVAALMDALDRRINSNTLWLPVATGVAAGDGGLAFHRWINGPELAEALARAEHRRGWCNDFRAGIAAGPIECRMQLLGPGEFRARLWWFLQDSQSYYQQPLSPQQAAALIDPFLALLRERNAVCHEIEVQPLREKLLRYFDGTEHDCAFLLQFDGGLALLLVNGGP
jgi:hypothetical protein